MKYEVTWSKAYYANGTVEIEATSVAEAEQIARDNIGGYTGSLQYYPDDDMIDVELKEE